MSKMGRTHGDTLLSSASDSALRHRAEVRTRRADTTNSCGGRKYCNSDMTGCLPCSAHCLPPNYALQIAMCSSTVVSESTVVGARLVNGVVCPPTRELLSARLARGSRPSVDVDSGTRGRLHGSAATRCHGQHEMSFLRTSSMFCSCRPKSSSESSPCPSSKATITKSSSASVPATASLA